MNNLVGNGVRGGIFSNPIARCNQSYMQQSRGGIFSTPSTHGAHRGILSNPLTPGTGGGFFIHFIKVPDGPSIPNRPCQGFIKFKFINLLLIPH
jgi:hypothetical protein